MQNYSPARLISLVSLVFGSAVGSALPAWSQSSPYLSGLQGDVRVGTSWAALAWPNTAEYGMLLSTWHYIHVTAGSSATLNCQNGTQYSLVGAKTYLVSDYCASSGGGSWSSRNSTRSTFDAGLPYLLAPRNTALLGDTPLVLSWNEVEGATSYRVSVQGRGVDWTIAIDDLSVIVPSSVVFEPNFTYAVTIETDNGRSSEGNGRSSFVVLPASEIERVRSEAAAIRAQRYEPDVEAIVLAMFYATFEHSDPDWQSFSLNQAALEVLAARVAAGTTNSQVFLLQGDIYAAIALPLQARDSYGRALMLAEASGRMEIQVRSLLGLAAIAEAQTEYAAAIGHLRAVRGLYEGVGDVERVEVLGLEERIQGLEAQVSTE